MKRYRKLSKDDAETLAKLGSTISRHSRSRTPTVAHGTSTVSYERLRTRAVGYGPYEPVKKMKPQFSETDRN